MHDQQQQMIMNLKNSQEGYSSQINHQRGQSDDLQNFVVGGNTVIPTNIMSSLNGS